MGDFFPGGVILDQERICSDEVLALLKDADIRVATLETAIGDDFPFDKEKMANPAWRNIIHTPNRGLNQITKLHIDVVTLANNHAFDMGVEGLLNAMSRLDSLGIKYCGAGRNLKEAQEPAVITINNKNIAFLGFMVYFEGWRAPHPAGENIPGLNIFELSTAEKTIKRAKEVFDYVFVLPHWGSEYNLWPTPTDLQIAKKLIDAGADGIFGSHTHQMQPSIYIKGKPVMFGMGNFIFPDFYMSTQRATCYPSPEDDFSLVPSTYEYERYPQCTLRRIWPESNRMGAMGSLIIDKTISLKVNKLKLNKDNVLELYTDKDLVAKINRISIFLKYTPYPILYRLHLFGSIKNFLRVVFRKIIK